MAKTANDIAQLFYNQLPQGGLLTERQTTWIMRQYRADSARQRREHHYAEGALPDGNQWQLFVKDFGRAKFCIVKPAVKEPPTRFELEVEVEELQERLEMLLARLETEQDAEARATTEKSIARVKRNIERYSGQLATILPS